jgi:hypothetical protein
MIKLEQGIVVSDQVNNQEAHFYMIEMSSKYDQGGNNLWVILKVKKKKD